MPVLLALSAVWAAWKRPSLIWWGPPLLAWATIKPQLVVLPILVILVRATRERRWLFIGMLAFWAGLLWGGAWLADGGRLYQEWFASLRVHSGMRNWLLSDWLRLTLVAAIGVTYWRATRRHDPLYIMIGATTLFIPLGSAYSIIGMLFSALTMQRRIMPLAWGISLLALVRPEISSSGLQLQLAVSLAGMALALILMDRSPYAAPPRSPRT